MLRQSADGFIQDMREQKEFNSSISTIFDQVHSQGGENFNIETFVEQNNINNQNVQRRLRRYAGSLMENRPQKMEEIRREVEHLCYRLSVELFRVDLDNLEQFDIEDFLNRHHVNSDAMRHPFREGAIEVFDKARYYKEGQREYEAMKVVVSGEIHTPAGYLMENGDFNADAFFEDYDIHNREAQCLLRTHAGRVIGEIRRNRALNEMRNQANAFNNGIVGESDGIKRKRKEEKQKGEWLKTLEKDRLAKIKEEKLNRIKRALALAVKDAVKQDPSLKKKLQSAAKNSRSLNANKLALSARTLFKKIFAKACVFAKKQLRAVKGAKKKRAMREKIKEYRNVIGILSTNS